MNAPAMIQSQAKERRSRQEISGRRALLGTSQDGPKAPHDRSAFSISEHALRCLVEREEFEQAILV